MNNIVRLIDNMEFMKTTPDKFYDLAIVDPPYGIGKTWEKHRPIKNRFKNSSYKNECIPDGSYFVELVRIAKNWIIWGANYYQTCWPSKNVIIWNKLCSWETEHHGEAEIAITSLNHRPISIFTFEWSGCRKSNETKNKNIHPHQKPIALYKWLLKNYAKPGWTIFDSHIGSGSIRIACHDMGFDLTGCENDPDCWHAQEERYKNHIAQAELFGHEELRQEVFIQPGME